MPGSLAAALLGAAQGVQILRVHDVAATRQALAVWEAAQDGAQDGIRPLASNVEAESGSGRRGV